MAPVSLPTAKRFSPTTQQLSLPLPSKPPVFDEFGDELKWLNLLQIGRFGIFGGQINYDGRNPTEGGEKGSGVFSGAFRTTAGMQRRFKPKLLRNLDHPICTNKQVAACALDRKSSSSEPRADSCTKSIQPLVVRLGTTQNFRWPSILPQNRHRLDHSHFRASN
jgi:hypothetical protein